MEAAEHLEQSNAANLDRSVKFEAENIELRQRVAFLEREKEKQAKMIQQLQRE